MNPVVLGWARHLVTVTTNDAERRVHAVVAKDGWNRVALCGALCPNGFAEMTGEPPSSEAHYRRCERCAQLAHIAMYELDLRDDLFALEHPEDGSEFTGSIFYVIATAPSGRRYAHVQRFPSAHVFTEDEYQGIASYRPQALAKAERFLEKVVAAQRAGRWNGPRCEHWVEIDPVYGSEAYVRAEPRLVARERADDQG